MLLRCIVVTVVDVVFLLVLFWLYVLLLWSCFFVDVVLFFWGVIFCRSVVVDVDKCDLIN